MRYDLDRGLPKCKRCGKVYSWNWFWRHTCVGNKNGYK